MVHYSHRDSPITARGEDETVMRKGPTGQLDKWPAAAVSASPFLSFPFLSSLTSLSLSYLIFSSVVFSLSVYCFLFLFRVPFLLISRTVSVFGVGPQSARS